MQIVVVKTQDNLVRIHEEPSIESKIIFTIPNNGVGIAEYVNDTWSKITYDGNEGYVLKCFLKSTQETFVTMTVDELKDLCKQIEGLLNTLKKFL